jgi:hypothetical protein
VDTKCRQYQIQTTQKIRCIRRYINAHFAVFQQSEMASLGAIFYVLFMNCLNVTPEKQIKKGNSKFFRFSSMGIQMGVIIAFFTWLGTFLDAKYHSTTAWWTIGLSLFGVTAALTLVIKEVIKMSKEKEDE